MTAVKTRNRSRRSTNSLSSAAPLDQFAAFCSELKIEDGSPFRLLDYQRTMLSDYFDGAETSLLLIPKKNGKSTLVAALALYHMVVTPDAECIIVARSRDQAEIVLRQAKLFMRRNESLQGLMRAVQRTIYSEVDEGRIRVLAADVDTADGVIPTLGIVDELHRAQSIGLYGVLRDGLGPRNGRMVAISTGGSDQASPLGLLRRGAHEMPGFHREGKYNYVRSPDGAFAFHEWCLDPDDDVGDMEVVKLANPAPWHTAEKLRKRHQDPATTPWQWKRFACGIWTEGEEPWLEPAAWDVLADPEMTIPDGSQVVMGVDIGVEHDSTAIALVARQGPRLAVKATIIPPPPRGSVSLEVVENEIRNLAERFRVRSLAYDPWAFRRSSEILAGEGIPVAKFPQSPERMSEASANLYRLIESGELVHDGDPRLRAHVMAGSVKETGRGWRLDKDPRHPREIDALIALVMAAQVATEIPPELTPLIRYGA